MKISTRNRMYTLLAVCLCVVVLYLLSACRSDSKSFADGISETLGVDVSSGTIFDSTDSHGGFHGDGTTFITIQFSDSSVEDELRQNHDWKAMPLDEMATALLYGMESEYALVGPYLTDEKTGEALFPFVENGYYFLLVRQPEDYQGAAEILDWPSFNFTVAVYDADSMTLYYGELDT